MPVSAEHRSRKRFLPTCRELVEGVLPASHQPKPSPSAAYGTIGVQQSGFWQRSQTAAGGRFRTIVGFREAGRAFETEKEGWGQVANPVEGIFAPRTKREG
jgi:hypothetical protein